MKLSIILPFFNRTDLLSMAIESVMNQHNVEDHLIELILVDDCSSMEFEAPSMRSNFTYILIRNAENFGVGTSRQIGIDHATGDYLFFLDSDDIWHENHLAECISLIAKEKAKALCSWYNIIAKKKTILKQYHMERLAHKNFKYVNPVGFSTFVVERNFLIKTGIKFPSIRKRNDFVFLHAISKSTEIAIKKTPTVTYNSLTGMTTKKMKLISFQWKVYRKYFGYNVIHSIFAIFYWIFYHKVVRLIS